MVAVVAMISSPEVRLTGSMMAVGGWGC